MIFRTGSVLVVGKCEDDILYHIYDFLKNILETNYLEICSPGTELRDNEAIALEKSNKKKKPRKKIVLFQ
jgi:tyrosyl-tRNA synthetase